MIKILKGIKHLHHLSSSLTYLPALTRSLSDSSLAKLTSQTKQVLNTHSISQTSSSQESLQALEQDLIHRLPHSAK